MSACLSWRSPEDELIIIDFCDLLDLTNWFSIYSLKLSVEWNIVAQSTIVSLELLEANATDLDSSLARSWSGLRMQVMNIHILIVGVGIFNVTVV